MAFSYKWSPGAVSRLDALRSLHTVEERVSWCRENGTPRTILNVCYEMPHPHGVQLFERLRAEGLLRCNKNYQYCPLLNFTCPARFVAQMAPCCTYRRYAIIGHAICEGDVELLREMPRPMIKSTTDESIPVREHMNDEIARLLIPHVYSSSVVDLWPRAAKWLNAYELREAWQHLVSPEVRRTLLAAIVARPQIGVLLVRSMLASGLTAQMLLELPAPSRDRLLRLFASAVFLNKFHSWLHKVHEEAPLDAIRVLYLSPPVDAEDPPFECYRHDVYARRGIFPCSRVQQEYMALGRMVHAWLPEVLTARVLHYCGRNRLG